VSELFFDELIAGDVVYTNSRGVLSRAIAEFARGLVSATVLAATKSSARLINVARGEIVDTGALTEALASGSIAAPRWMSWIPSRCPKDTLCGAWRTS
jgi:hypothetical protein